MHPAPSHGVTIDKPGVTNRGGADVDFDLYLRPKWRSSIPERMERYRPIKKPVTMRLDADVIAWFKKSGRGYQTRINRELRKMMKVR